MSALKKKSPRKSVAKKLEPIDWHEFANDAVLNGNMSTLYHRPPTEDSTAYASPEALREIKKRVGRPVPSGVVIDLESAVSSGLNTPTVGTIPTVGSNDADLEDVADGASNSPGVYTGPQSVFNQPAQVSDMPTVGTMPTVGVSNLAEPTLGRRSAIVDDPPSHGVTMPTVGTIPTVGPGSTVGGDENKSSKHAAEEGGAVDPTGPTVGPRPVANPSAYRVSRATADTTPSVDPRSTGAIEAKRKTKPIRNVQDALTLAGHVLYKAMYGAPDGGAKSKTCTKGYRQLAAETHLDKDTVRDLISEFKGKGLIRETGTYDPDTRSAKTYEVFAYKTILQMWRDVGLMFVTAGRQRPCFCTAQGEPLTFRPTVGREPAASKKRPAGPAIPTVGLTITEPAGAAEISQVAQGEPLNNTEVIQALQQITGGPVDQEAAHRLIQGCRAEAADCTTEEIVEFAWSKAFLCRSGRIENPVGFLITQVPKHFQGEALQVYRERKRSELESAAEMAAREEERHRESERERAEMEERQRVRSQIAEQHRKEQGIDLQSLLQDPEADEVLKQWAKRMLKLGQRYQLRYD